VRSCHLLLFAFGPAILLSASSAVCHQSGQEASLKGAQGAYARGEYRIAVERLQDYLRAYPHNYDANELMGLALVAERQPLQARPFLTTAARLLPSSSLAHANLAANLAQLHQDAAAEGEFRTAIELEPENPELNHNLGEFYAARGRVKEAVAYLQKSQQLRPSYDNGYDLALAELDSGMLDEAEKQIRAMLAQKDASELHSLLGETYEKKHEFLQAANELQQAAVLDPSENNIFAWGSELLNHRTIDPALQVFRNGTERFPKSWKLQLGWGVSQYMLGHNDQAANAFCRAIDLNPGDPRPYFFLSKVHGISQAQAREVSERFERHVMSAPKDAKAHFYYAMNLWDSDNEHAEMPDLPKIKALLREAVSLDPKDAEMHLELGILYAKESNEEAALKQYQRAVDLDPELTVARYRLGQLLIRMGQKQRGQEELATWNKLKAQQDQDTDRKQKEMLLFLYSAKN
jgi:Flp pilus assembly protein TadD